MDKQQISDRTRTAAEQYRQAKATWYDLIARKRPTKEIDTARRAFDEAAHGLAFEVLKDIEI